MTAACSPRDQPTIRSPSGTSRPAPDGTTSGAHRSGRGDRLQSRRRNPVYGIGRPRVLAWDIDGERRLFPRTALVDLRPTSARLRSLPPTARRWCTSGPSAPGPKRMTRSSSSMSDRAGSAPSRPAAATSRRRGNRPTSTCWPRRVGDGFVRMWDRSDGTLAVERQCRTGPITALAFTADGTRLLVAELTKGSSRSMRPDLESVGPTSPVRSADPRVGCRPGRADRGGLVRRRFAVDHRSGRWQCAPPGAPRVRRPDRRHLARRPRSSPVVCFNGEVALIDIETGACGASPRSARCHHPGCLCRGYARTAPPSRQRERPVSSASGTARPARPRGVGPPGRAHLGGRRFLPDGTRSDRHRATGAVYTWSSRPEDWIDHACDGGRAQPHRRRVAGDVRRPALPRDLSRQPPAITIVILPI